MLKLYDVVKLKTDRNDIGVKAGAEGTIIDIIGDGVAYSVEVFDDNNDTVGESIYTHFFKDELILSEAGAIDEVE